MTAVFDQLARPLGSLRLSVTDRCNLRCAYCMPEEEYTWLPRASILSFEELARLAAIFASLGAGRVRLTGGEPLLRNELPDLVSRLAALPRVTDIALTTNGLLLARDAEALRRAGLGRVTISLDTLDPGRFRTLTRSAKHADVLAGVEAAAAAGFRGTKLNTVVMRGVNDDEIGELLAFGRRHSAELRFIEYMDVGGATGWAADKVVSRAELLARIGREHGPVEAVPEPDSRAPAERFRLADGTTFGIIASTTAPFCRTCDRSRITADGTWFLCLYGAEGVDLRVLLRGGNSDGEIADRIRTIWRTRADRGAELRASLPERGALYAIEGLRADPRREMHTRGG
ncbi:MAG: GTP 3',8-cyclase MoaA [Gemmatimonadota bacterium]